MIILYVKTKTPQLYLSKRSIAMFETSVRDARRGAAPLSVPLHRTTLYNKSFTVKAFRLYIRKSSPITSRL